MNIKDLGQVASELILYGRPYSNLAALDALYKIASDMNVPPEAMICTGDVVAYGADPVKTVELFRSRGGIGIAGNCEKQLAANAGDCGCGFDAGSTCDVLSRGWYPYADKAITPEIRTFFASLPDVIVFTQNKRQYAVIHGGMTDISRFVWPDVQEAVFAAEIKAIQDAVGPIDGVISGHSGIAFERVVNGVHWVNAGVIGMPEHDGSPDTRYVVLKNGQASIKKLSYDFVGSATRMNDVGLTQGYDRALICGYWPSEAILPLSMRLGKTA